MKMRVVETDSGRKKEKSSPPCRNPVVNYRSFDRLLILREETGSPDGR